MVTILVLIIVSMHNKKENQPPASLGNNYFQEAGSEGNAKKGCACRKAARSFCFEFFKAVSSGSERKVRGVKSQRKRKPERFSLLRLPASLLQFLMADFRSRKSNSKSFSPIGLKTCPGFPTATTLEGRSFVTTLPAPTTVFSPMDIPGRSEIAPAPIQQLRPMCTEALSRYAAPGARAEWGEQRQPQ